MRLTLFGRALLLLASELAANVICWIVAAVLFAPNPATRPTLTLALLAWTIGLRHALDADHISAIDNATRSLINLRQLSVTCGLFFSLGHSTIVIVVTVAIAISSDVFNKLHTVGNVGGIIGTSVSGAFLFIIGLANSIILCRIIKRRRRDKKRAEMIANGQPVNQEPYDDKHNHMLMMRILGPVITFVNRPWKMYPVGVLFGLGFDTASSIALIGVSALARKDQNGNSMPSSHIVILPLLFTSGMTVIDSADSILMLYSYTEFSERAKGWALFERGPETPASSQLMTLDAEKQEENIRSGNAIQEVAIESLSQQPDLQDTAKRESENNIANKTRVKMHIMSGLSIVLTFMSILVAFSISLIEIMGLISENCAQCMKAADDPGGGGLAGSWWRAWLKANDQLGYIGVAIVGGFLVLVAAWYGGKWVRRKLASTKNQIQASNGTT